MRYYAAFMKCLATSSISAALFIVFEAIAYPAYGRYSWIVGIPLAAAPWFYFYRRRPAPSQLADARAPQLAETPSPPSAAAAPPVKPSEDPGDFRLGQTVNCQQCSRAMTIGMPRKDATGKILLASVDDMMGFAFRCRDCNYITCARCALLAYEMHNPRQGIPTCPNCGKVAVPFFAEWLTIKEKERAAERPAERPAELHAAAASTDSQATDSPESAAVVQRLLGTPYTCAIYARVSDPAGKSATCFLLHEEGARVRAMPEQVAIEVRTALLEMRGVGVVVVLLRVGGELYETYWNYHIPELRACFDDMASQDALLIRFYTDSVQPSRTLTLPNSLRETFAIFKQQLSAATPWRMEQFDAAKAAIAVDFPSVQALWEGIAEQRPAAGRA